MDKNSNMKIKGTIQRVYSKQGHNFEYKRTKVDLN